MSLGNVNNYGGRSTVVALGRSMSETSLFSCCIAQGGLVLALRVGIRKECSVRLTPTGVKEEPRSCCTQPSGRKPKTLDRWYYFGVDI